MDTIQGIPAAFIGAFLGTLAAFLTERFLRRTDAKNVELAAVNNLVTDLYLRRALTLSDNAQRVPNGEESGDQILATRAVIEIRNGIRETRLVLRPSSSGLFQALVVMSSACNNYLENVRRSTNMYQLHLVELRDALKLQVEVLAKTKKVVHREPGRGAFLREDGLTYS